MTPIRKVAFSLVFALVAGGCSEDANITGAMGSAAGTGVAPTGNAGAAGAFVPAAGTGMATSNSTAGRSAVPSNSAGTSAAGRSGAAGTGGSAIAGTRGGAQAGMAGSVAGSSGSAGAAAGGASGGMAGASGSAAGGAGGSGSATCEFPEPPADVAGWVDESWKAQLGMNIKSRKAWNLDNVMLNKGEMNLCVRWGATSAVPAEVSKNLAPTIERWFNDWFKGLNGYGCFPYGAGIKVNVTGWAVRPGKQSLLANVDPAIPVYTETDNEGEPKCPDACSSFVHWDHQFPDCQAGADKHSDYWLWFDDTLPGSGGAAAVGGDWGLRMPVNTFLNAFNKPSDNIIEHEMGHGFGIQDYYDWTGSKPKGGSIMIVGSSQSQAPTMADIWLLRRTWKEMKSMRGW